MLVNRSKVRSVGDAMARRSPAQAVFVRRSARRLAVLAYHGVDHPDHFAAQLVYLVKHCRPVSLDNVVAALGGGPALPERAALVTFDDGCLSVLTEGLPLLRAHDVPAVAFVLPGLVGTRRAFWWAEAACLHEAGVRVPQVAEGSAAAVVARLKTMPDHDRREVLTRMRAAAPTVDTATDQLTAEHLLELEAGGVEIGNHTWSHPCLDRCDDDEVARQVERAHVELTSLLGRPPRAFAYPNGNHDARTERHLSRLGYDTAFLFDHRLTDMPARQPLRISRLRVGSGTPLDRFATILSGLHPRLHHGRGRH